MGASEILATCMIDRCCDTDNDPITSDQCLITTDHFGENIRLMKDHPIYESNNSNECNNSDECTR